jgi:hypothetical protein
LSAQKLRNNAQKSRTVEMRQRPFVDMKSLMVKIAAVMIAIRRRAVKEAQKVKATQKKMVSIVTRLYSVPGAPDLGAVPG